MALLWHKKRIRCDKSSKCYKNNQQLINKSGNPSPTNIEYIKEFAQNLLCAIKGSSLLHLLRKKLRAGMTVEAAAVLPIFLFFFLNLAGLMEVMRLHGNLQFTLWGAGNEAALFGCVLEDEAAGRFLSSFYIRSQMVQKLGEEYLESSPLENGLSELKVITKPLSSSESILDVEVFYRVTPFFAFIGFPSFQMSNCYYAHLWNGYEIPETVVENEVVYVTENGVVYHKDRNCTHLLLSVQKVGTKAIPELRNQWGRTYGSCAKCVRGDSPNEVFITREGECYHYDEGCSGLKRTVRAIRLEEAQKRYRCCSRCG